MARIIGNFNAKLVYAIPIGVGVGGLAVWLDHLILRFLSRRQMMSRSDFTVQNINLGHNVQSEMMVRASEKHFPIFGQSANSRIIGQNQAQQNFRTFSGDLEFGFWAGALVAIMEETIHRGFIVNFCFLITNDILIFTALVVSVLIFSLSHIWFGWHHVLSKLPLGALCTLSVVFIGSIVPAILAHMIFNFKVWLDKKR